MQASNPPHALALSYLLSNKLYVNITKLYTWHTKCALTRWSEEELWNTLKYSQWNTRKVLVCSEWAYFIVGYVKVQSFILLFFYNCVKTFCFENTNGQYTQWLYYLWETTPRRLTIKPQRSIKPFKNVNIFF